MNPEQSIRFTKILHRVTGVGMLLFLALHILHIWLMGFGPGIFNAITAVLHHPVGRLLHIFLFFGVLFHAVNGVRMMLVDFIPALERYQRHTIFVSTFIFALVFIPSALLILMDAFLPSL